MKCSCSIRREQLALLVGQDATAELPEDIRRSLANCPRCREHYQQLSISQQALAIVKQQEPALLQESLWPALSGRLEKIKPKPSHQELFQRRFIPAFSMTAACLAVLVSLWENSPSNTRIYQMSGHQSRNAFVSPLLPVSEQLTTPTSHYAPDFQAQSGFPLLQTPERHEAMLSPAEMDGRLQTQPMTPSKAEEMLRQLFRSEQELRRFQ